MVPKKSYRYSDIITIIGKESFTNFPGHIEYDTVSLQQIYEIAKVKKEIDVDLKDVSLQAICRVIISYII